MTEQLGNPAPVSRRGENMTEKYVVGLDFGTLSGRAAVVRVSDGEMVGTAVCEYPHAVMDTRLTAANGQELPPDFALQDPSDYLTALYETVPAAVADSGVEPADIIGVGLDFTSATVVAATIDGTPVCELPQLADNPHAWVKLWKHHGAVEQARRIVDVATERGEEWLSRYGGVLNSEMLLPKVTETLECAPEVYAATDVFCEAMDWLTWHLTGRLTFSAGSSGYKRILQDGRYPSRDFLRQVNPGLENVYDEKMNAPVLPLGHNVGGLLPEVASRLGLPAGIAVASGNIDAHVTGPAVQGVEDGVMTAIMGTSVCYLLSWPTPAPVAGIFGIVDGGIVDGSWGFEAGQTAAGDIFAWFVDTCVPARYQAEADELGIPVHELLTRKCEHQPVGAHGLVALDWHNGNRSTLMDAQLSGLMLGTSLTTTPEDQYRALLESCAFGARTIIEAFVSAGIDIEELVVAGGLTRNRLFMQILADVCRRPLSVGTAEQPGALGSAIFAAVAAGEYPDVKAASAAMGAKKEGVYLPDEARADQYDLLYAEYSRLYDYFGRGGNEVMHRLKSLRAQARAASA
jgi:L-ribulokinase